MGLAAPGGLDNSVLPGGLVLQHVFGQLEG